MHISCRELWIIDRKSRCRDQHDDLGYISHSRLRNRSRIYPDIRDTNIAGAAAGERHISESNLVRVVAGCFGLYQVHARYRRFRLIDYKDSLGTWRHPACHFCIQRERNVARYSGISTRARKEYVAGQFADPSASEYGSMAARCTTPLVHLSLYDEGISIQ